MIDKFLDIKSIDPKYWGKSGWIFLNSIALTYKPELKESYKNFILQLPNVLPCKTCGENLKKNMCTLDNALINKENLLKWLINVRNGIYSDNGEKYKSKNIKSTIDEIFYLNSNSSQLYLWVIVSILLVLILIYLLSIELKKKN